MIGSNYNLAEVSFRKFLQEFISSPSALHLRTKCCPRNESFSYKEYKCVERPRTSKFFDSFPAEVQFEFPCAFGSDSNHLNESVLFHEVSGNGILTLVMPNQTESRTEFRNFLIGEYCYDYMPDTDNLMLFVCHDDIQPYSICYLIVFHVSLILTFLTFCWYLFTRELRKKVYDKCFIAYMFFQLLATVTIVVDAYFHENIINKVFLFFLPFEVSSAFCWLNAMCFHLWRSVRTMQPVSDRSFLLYTCYALGFPILCCIAFTIDFALSKVKVGLRLQKGIFSDLKFLYVFNVCGIIQIINLYLFVHIAFIIWYQRRGWNGSENADSQKHQKEKHLFVQYFKLFVIMGLNWMIFVAKLYIKDPGVLLVEIFRYLGTCPGYLLFLIFVYNNERAVAVFKNQHPWINSLKVF